MYRQGDLLLVEAEMPATTKETKKELITSELSGHSHTAYNCEVLTDKTGQKFLITTENAVIKHEKRNGETADHTPIELPADKTYRVIVQQCYDYFGGHWKSVLD